MTATEELRRLLDERGVEWQDFQHENHTWWFDSGGFDSGDACWHAENRPTPSGMLVKIDATVTPERAIAATLGDVDLAAENAELRELASFMWQRIITPSEQLIWPEIADRLRKLGVERWADE